MKLWDKLQRFKWSNSYVISALLLLIMIVVVEGIPPKYLATIDASLNQVNNYTGYPDKPLIYPQEKSIKIGGMFDLTDVETGLPQSSGIQQALAFQCAITRHNNAVGPNGVNFQYYMEDTASSVSYSLLAAQNMLEEGDIVSVIGPTTYNQASAVASLFQPLDVPVISYSASSSTYSNYVRSPGLFRISPSDIVQANAIAATMAYMNWTLTSAIFTNDDYGTSGYLAFMAASQTYGLRNTCMRTLTYGTTSNLNQTINCLSGSMSSVVLLWMDTPSAQMVISQIYSSGLLDGITFIASDMWANVPDIEAFTMGRFPTSYLEGTLCFSPDPGNQTDILNCFQNASPNNTDISNFQQYWETSFNCKYTTDPSYPMCDNTMANRASTTNPTCRCTGSENLLTLNPDAMLGYVSDSVTAISNALDLVYTANPGADSIDLTELYDYLINSSFVGDTGEVNFLNNDRIFTKTNIAQIVLPHNYTSSVGIFDGENITIHSHMLTFKQNTIPISAIIPNAITYNDINGQMVIAVIILSMLATGACHIYFYIYRDEKIIKKTSPVFCQLMLVGVNLSLASQILWVFPQSRMTCVAKIWMLTLGFGLLMGNLLAKTYRIFKIFASSRIIALTISDSDLLKVSGLVMFIEIALLSFYTFGSGCPLPIVVQSPTVTLLQYVQCEVTSTTIQTWGKVALLGFNGILVVLGVVVAFLVRKVDSEYNESRYIGMTMYTYLMVVIIIIPLYYTTDDVRINSQVLLRSAGVWIAMTFTLAFLFLPKIFTVRRVQRQTRKIEVTTFNSTLAGAGRITEVCHDNSMEESSGNSDTDSISRIATFSTLIGNRQRKQNDHEPNRTRFDF